MAKDDAERSNGLLDALIKPIKLTPNVPPFERRPYNDGKKIIMPALPVLRGIAQRIIDGIDDHRHLKCARVLMTLTSSEADRRKLARGERVKSSARKVTPLMRMLAAPPAAPVTEAETKKQKADREKEEKVFGVLPGFDFLVDLQADLLKRAGALDGEVEGLRLAAALIDHELSHCGQKIAGTFVPRAELADFVADLGDAHEETCNDLTDDDGKVLVRYRVFGDDGRPAFVMRPHDLEEFAAVVGRWGRWHRQVGELVDQVIDYDRHRLPLAAQ